MEMRRTPICTGVTIEVALSVASWLKTEAPAPWSFPSLVGPSQGAGTDARMLALQGLHPRHHFLRCTGASSLPERRRLLPH